MSEMIEGLKIERTGLAFPRPVNLAREAMRLKKKYSALQDAVRPRAVEAARALLARWRKGQEVSALERRGLVLLFADPDTEEEVRATASTVLRVIARELSLGQLLALWQLDGAGRDITGPALRRRVVERLEAGRGKGIPAWFCVAGRAPHADYRGQLRGPRVNWAAFTNPIVTLRNWIEHRQIPLDQLESQGSSEVGISLSVGIGLEAVRQLILKSSVEWWRLAGTARALAWAGNRQMVLQQAVADRALVEIGGSARNPADFARLANAEAKRTMSWVRAVLGEPEFNPGRWLGVSPRAREVFEALALVDELGKIFAEFEKHAEADRAAFWRQYLHVMSDARIYLATDTAICMLVIGRRVIIEFGVVGHAAYVYQAEWSMPRLRTLRLPEGLSSIYFKERDESRPLVLGGPVRLTFLERFLHTQDWAARFAGKLRGFGVVPKR